MSKTNYNTCLSFRRLKMLLVLMSALNLLNSIEAQVIVYKAGDLLLGLRKTGTNQGTSEVVVDLGAATNYVYLAPGATKNITQYSASQLVPDSFNNLNFLTWSVSGYTLSSRLFTNYPANTIWVTVPRSGGTQAPAASRNDVPTQQGTISAIASIGNGAKLLSGMSAAGPDNTTTLVQELYSTAQGLNYGAYVADQVYPNIGDLQGYAPLDVNGKLLNIETTTASPFSAAVQADLYQLVPTGTADPNNGATSGAGYYVGYFQLNTDGTMIFVRASTTVAAPTAAFAGSPTNGFAPLSVLFTDASTGTITNWIWNFGDGNSVTNTSNAAVSHTYNTVGNFTASLTVTGPGGFNTATKTAYVTTTSRPTLSTVTAAGGKLVFTVTNYPPGVQYRILSSTNLTLPLASWKPVVTNFFPANGSFSYTNSTAGLTGFFLLVSP